ncbi:hypothetical protein SBA7_810005 [Candidatus Sulfotelmatobacter sp. SbA7]|nr:hypothetical protein SBA7_810005 [Candidatus Sulfotelmatobacter sp. SbA7]
MLLETQTGSGILADPKVKTKVKSSGQECPLYTTSVNPAVKP